MEIICKIANLLLVLVITYFLFNYTKTRKTRIGEMIFGALIGIFAMSLLQGINFSIEWYF